MRIYRNAGILAFASVLTFIALERPALADPPPLSKSVAGTAVDGRGVPVEGALVRCWVEDEYKGTGWFAQPQPVEADSGDGAPTTTDADGRFQIRVPVPDKGRAWIQVEADGFVPAATEWLVADRVISEAVGTLALRRLRSITGRIVDREGSPLADVEVFQVGDTHQRTSTMTAANGQFTLSGAADGTTIIFAKKVGYRFQGRVVAGGDETGDMVLARADEDVPPLRTLPLPLSREEELRLCHDVADNYWRALVSTQDENRIRQVTHWYGCLDPWAVVEQGKGYSVFWLAPTLYADDPEQALAEIELDKDPQIRARSLIKLCRYVAADQHNQRRNLLDRAYQHALGVVVPETRSDLITAIAKLLTECGELERARALLEELRPMAETFTDEDSRGRFADALTPFDAAAAIDIVTRLKNEMEASRFQFRVAHQLSGVRPEDADRLLQRVEKASAEHGYPSNFDDIKAAAVCFRMANADLPRALDIARRMGNPFLRAYGYGMAALAISQSDHARARQLIADAFDQLEQTAQSQKELEKLDRAWLSMPPSNVALALLPVVEEVDPSLVNEYLWRGIALRLPHVVGRDSQRIDTATAMLVARYDRKLAKLMIDRLARRLPEVVHAGHSWTLVLLPQALTLVDPMVGAQLIKSAPQPSVAEPSSDRSYAQQFYVSLLAQPQRIRWPLVTVTLQLWRPEEEVLDELGLVW